MEDTMESMSPRLPPGVFISITIAVAFWLWAVATTRDMKAAEPGSTGTLKSAMTTAFPDAAGWVDAVAEEPKKLLTTSKNSTATSNPKMIETRKTFPFNFNNFLLFLAIQQATYKL
jgi:hypothetical protein